MNNCKWKDATKKSVGTNCNLISHKEVYAKPTPLFDATLNAQLITNKILDSSGSNFSLNSNIKNTSSIYNPNTSNQNKLVISMKQRHISSTPLLPLDKCVDSNVNTRENLHIVEKQSRVHYLARVLDTTCFSSGKNIVQNSQAHDPNTQIQHNEYEKRTKKIVRIEKELDLVKSSWDEEARFIRYNMEILRNEIDLFLKTNKKI